MEYNEKYELIIHNLSYGESRFMDDKRYEDYSHTAALWLNHQGIHLFQDEIMAKYNNYAKKSFEEILKDNKHEYLPGHIVQRGDKREQVYYYIWGNETVDATDPFFPYFFACKLSHTDILNLDDFLNYHLENSFEKNTDKFFRSLTLVFRRYEHLLKPATIETAKEWITATANAIKTEYSEPESKRIKGRKLREPGDNRTSLSGVQTAILIKFMQEAGILLGKNELNFIQAGRAFDILTGYSMSSTRQLLGIKGEISGAKNEDYKELHEVIIRLASLIESKIRKK